MIKPIKSSKKFGKSPKFPPKNLNFPEKSQKNRKNLPVGQLILKQEEIEFSTLENFLKTTL